MSAHVLLNLLYELEKSDKCEACQAANAHACLTIKLNFVLSLYLRSLLQKLCGGCTFVKVTAQICDSAPRLISGF